MPEFFLDTLANGLRLLTVEMPHLHSVELSCSLGIGSRHEEPHLAGISHFLEHMLFRGSQDYPSSQDLESRFEAIGDHETVAVLRIILQEEVGHVHFGSHWFHYLCEQRGLEPEQTYFDLLENFLNGEIRCPLHHQARREAGFSNQELERVETLCADG